MTEKERFVTLIITKQLEVMGKPKAAIQLLLTELQFVEIAKLMGMDLWKFTQDEVERLRQEVLALAARLVQVRGMTPYQLWRTELAELEAEYVNYTADRALQYSQEPDPKRKSGHVGSGQAKRTKK